MSLSKENIRQSCVNASTGTQSFPPGPVPSTGIRPLIGAKLFCLANEVRWWRGVVGKFWNLEVWEEGQGQTQIRMPLRILSSIVRNIFFAINNWRMSLSFCSGFYFRFIFVRKRKPLRKKLVSNSSEKKGWLFPKRGPRGPGPCWRMKRWVNSGVPSWVLNLYYRELKLRSLGSAANPNPHWHVREHVTEDNSFRPHVPTRRSPRSTRGQDPRKRSNSDIIRFRLISHLKIRCINIYVLCIYAFRGAYLKNKKNRFHWQHCALWDTFQEFFLW